MTIQAHKLNLRPFGQSLSWLNRYPKMATLSGTNHQSSFPINIWSKLTNLSFIHLQLFLGEQSLTQGDLSHLSIMPSLHFSIAKISFTHSVTSSSLPSCPLSPRRKISMSKKLFWKKKKQDFLASVFMFQSTLEFIHQFSHNSHLKINVEISIRFIWGQSKSSKTYFLNETLKERHTYNNPHLGQNPASLANWIM